MEFFFLEKTPLKPLSTTFSKMSVFAITQGLYILLRWINKFKLNSVSSLVLSLIRGEKKIKKINSTKKIRKK